METHRLICHPDTHCSAINSISVKTTMLGPDCLELLFVISGEIGKVYFPANGKHERKGQLWEQTCFEMFSRNASYDAYEELNFAPSSDWAFYDFQSYRVRCCGEELALSPEISTDRSPTEFRLRAKAALAKGSGPWLVGFSAVIEETDGTKSYWALAHPPGKPDFHHPTCFAATLPPPE